MNIIVNFYKLKGEVFDYLVAHGRMKEKEARAKFRQVCVLSFAFERNEFICQLILRSSLLFSIFIRNTLYIAI